VLIAAVATEVLAAVVSENAISSVVIVTMVAILPARTVVFGILIEEANARRHPMKKARKRSTWNSKKWTPIITISLKPMSLIILWLNLYLKCITLFDLVAKLVLDTK